MKKKSLFVLLSSSLLLLSSCGDARYPRTFTVKFVTGEGGQVIADQQVKEGYLVEGVSDPEHEKEHIFRGWYTDSEYKNFFDVSTFRVFEDLTLYAKWTFPTNSPQEIELGKDPFTKSITWIQKNVKDHEANVSIKAYVGDLTYAYEYNADYDKYLVSGTEITYGESPVLVDLPGTISTNGDYEVTFTVANPDTKYYWIVISALDSSFETAEIKDVHFKGNGTQANPYLVYNETDLKYLTTNSFDQNTYVELKADVTISSIYNEKKSAKFDGHFSGSKSNALIQVADNYAVTLKNNSGLFQTLGEHAVIEDMSFRGSISGSDPSIGVVANYNYGLIQNVDSQAVSINSNGGKVNDFSTLDKGGSGGIVGTNYGTITKCTVSSARDNVVQGHIGVGGIAGINYGTIKEMQVDAIVGAYNGNEISTTINNSFAGCVAGVNFGTIDKIDVYSGKINCRRIDNGSRGEGANNVGGVVGYNAKDGVITNTTFDGMRIVGDTNVGGIAGYNDGLIKNCYTGRRLRSPSNTTITERRFLSPVIGSYNVCGIAGEIGENSVITNVFSTANVWAYGEPGYTIAKKADNAIGVLHNMHPRTSSNYLGMKYGAVKSNDLVAPEGEHIIMVDNSALEGLAISWGLGFRLNKNGVLVADYNAVKTYLELLGDGFGFRDSASHGIRLVWEKSVKAYADIEFPEE